MATFTDEFRKPCTSSGWLDSSDDSRWKEVRGTIETPWGLVRVYAYFEKNKPSKGQPLRRTVLEVIGGGQVISRTFNRFYQPSYIVTLAKRFAEEACGGKM